MRDLASGAIQNLERNFMSLDRRIGLGTENIQAAFQPLGVGLAVLTTGAATVGAAFSLASAAGRFEQVVAAAGATATERTQLRDAAIEAGLATQSSPTEATRAAGGQGRLSRLDDGRRNPEAAHGPTAA
ncbi:hypothetical protein [Corallococcus sp. EGB]|uniref:hypothetical protein n=1 Tax=Corallococcus sp. EGB TaxID=1521117 RepID=UPI001CBB1F1C|nr:hypothetical protein [Corallococcus sp. EGB]